MLTTTRARTHAPGILKAVTAMIQATETDPRIPDGLRTFVNIRVSQINGCLH
ncbi:MAG: hypothetical protein QGF68_02660 [Nitrospinota bacterium]|nr:hypothetical protein [Nitrospinota bacterium]HJM41853.1 hypothetical protein [Nitrospinota bacterium]